LSGVVLAVPSTINPRRPSSCRRTMRVTSPNRALRGRANRNPPHDDHTAEVIERSSRDAATSLGRCVGATHAAATLSDEDAWSVEEDAWRLPAQHSAAPVDLRVAALDAAPRAAVRFASYHGPARVQGGATWRPPILVRFTQLVERQQPSGTQAHFCLAAAGELRLRLWLTAASEQEPRRLPGVGAWGGSWILGELCQSGELSASGSRCCSGSLPRAAARLRVRLRGQAGGNVELGAASGG
jgi:hypothetical protein